MNFTDYSMVRDKTIPFTAKLLGEGYETKTLFQRELREGRKNSSGRQ